MKRTKTVNNSRRPKSIPNASSHFARSGNGWKVPEGPIILPRPGPTFAKAVPAPDVAVIISTPVALMPILRITKQIKKKNRKLVTELITEGVKGPPLYLG